MRRVWALALALVVIALGASGIAAVAQIAPDEPAPPTTEAPTTTVPPATTTTAPPVTITPPPQQPPPTTATTRPTPPTTQAPASPSAPPGDGDEEAPAPGQRVIPPEYREMINSVRRTPANNTGALLEALAPLRSYGLSEAEIATVGFGRFPVGGFARYSDDWWNPRFNPYFHLHMGNDIFAPHGAPVRAPADGIIRQSIDSVGGISVYLLLPDGTRFYMTHLSGYPEGQQTGQSVKTGDIIGYVGSSGNAAGGAPHLHLEIRPRGGPQVNPKPYLDQWLQEAIDNVPNVLAAFTGSRPRAVISTGLTRELADGTGGLFAAASTPPRSQLLWASSANPVGGALRLAEAEASAAASQADLGALSQRQAERQVAWEMADARARAMLTPLTPRALHFLLKLDWSLPIQTY